MGNCMEMFIEFEELDVARFYYGSFVILCSSLVGNNNYEINGRSSRKTNHRLLLEEIPQERRRVLC